MPFHKFPVIPMALVDSFPAFLEVARKSRVSLARRVRLFTLEFLETLPAIEFERPVLERALDRTTGLIAMRAIAEPAQGGERRDIGKRRVERRGRRVPELQLAHARRVDDEHAGWRDDQFAPGRRVPAFADGVADCVRRLPFDAENPIDERGFSDAR